MTPAPIHHRSARSPSIHYVEFPAAGPTLLLLHGVTRNWRDWESVIPHFAKDWRVIAVDHLGHGDSEPNPQGYRVIDYARAMSEFVSETFSSPITVMGHSLGAMVALSLAAECKPLVRSAILEDPPFHSMGEQIASTRYLDVFRGMQSVVDHGGGVEAMTESMAKIRVPADQGTVELGEIRDRASLRFSAESLGMLDPRVLTPLVESQWLDAFDHLELWPQVDCPVLLLQGDAGAGGAFTDEDVERATAGLTNCSHVKFEGVGHGIHSSSPEKLLVAFDRFVSTVG